jgi:hypothetical protein
MVKTLTNDQKEVTDYIKKILIIKCWYFWAEKADAVKHI